MQKIKAKAKVKVLQTQPVRAAISFYFADVVPTHYL